MCRLKFYIYFHIYIDIFTIYLYLYLPTIFKFSSVIKLTIFASLAQLMVDAVAVVGSYKTEERRNIWPNHMITDDQL